MKSIRPLVTITLLTIAGVYLYFKINESQPQLPADVANWNLPAEVDIQELSVESLPGDAGVYGNSGAPGKSPYPNQNASQPSSSGQNFGSTPNPENLSKTPSWNDATTKVENQSATPVPATSNAIPDLPPLPTMPAESTPLSTQAMTQGVTTETGSNRQPDPPQSLAGADAPAVNSSPQASLFGATRLAVQGALDRGELSQALLLLSDWYGDPSLAVEEKKEVNTLLGQLAGSVIYSTEHRLEPPYQVQAGESLEAIGEKFDVPWQLLAKINGIERPNQLQPGQKIKVIRGPFSALIDLGDRQMTIMLARRYAGKFAIEFDPQVTVEEGHWTVDQKLITPASIGLPPALPGQSQVGQESSNPTEEQSLVLTSTTTSENQVALLKGPGTASAGVVTEPKNRVIRLKEPDVENVYDILSVGSKVIIRR